MANPRIALELEAHRALRIWAGKLAVNETTLLSELVLAHAPADVLGMIGIVKAASKQPKKSPPKPGVAAAKALSRNTQAIEELKSLWNLDPRPSLTEIAKLLGYPIATVSYNIERLKKSGELPTEPQTE